MVLQHIRHTPEIEEQLGYAAGKQFCINFTPHLSSDEPWNPSNCLCNPEQKMLRYEEVKAVYDKYYKE